MPTMLYVKRRRKLEQAVLMAALLSAMFLAAFRAESLMNAPESVSDRPISKALSFVDVRVDTIVSENSLTSVKSFNFGSRH